MKRTQAYFSWGALCMMAGATGVSCSYDLESLRAGHPGDDAGGGMAQMTIDAAKTLDTDEGSTDVSPDDEDAYGGQGGLISAGGRGGATGGMGGSVTMGGSGGTPTCSPQPEACNNRDDDCDGVTDNGAPCPPSVIRDGWIYFFGTQLLSWNDARAWCQRLGRDAVILNDKAEHTWFAVEASLHSRTCRWLGLTDAAVEGQWVWVNGTPMQFSYWGPEQPNNAGADGEHCVGLIPLAYLDKPSIWHDIMCDGAVAALQCLPACRGRAP